MLSVARREMIGCTGAPTVGMDESCKTPKHKSTPFPPKRPKSQQFPGASDVSS